MSVVFDVSPVAAVNRHRREVSRELARMLQSIDMEYAEIWGRIDQAIDRLVLVDVGSPPRRLLFLRETLPAELGALAVALSRSLPARQRQFIELAIRHSRESVSSELGRNASAPPVAAFEPFVGYGASGAPLPERFSTLASRLGEKYGGIIAATVAAAVAQNYTLRKTSTEIRSRIDARRETGDAPQTVRAFYSESHGGVLHAYRETSREVMRQNGVRQWRWVSSRNRRTCLACWAMDGRVFEIAEPMAAHPNCRCIAVPVGPNTDRFFPDTGEQAFERLPDADKAAIMGAAKFRAYREGAVSLADFVGVSTSPMTGPAYVERSLKSILGDDARTFYRP